MRATQAKELKSLDAKSLGKALKKKRPKLHTKHRSKPVKTVRTDCYKGFEIEIETTYDIKVNGERIGGHIELQNNGQIHYHPLPNYGWTSAVDFVRQLIDSFPDDFKSKKSVKKTKSASRGNRKSKKTSRKRKSQE